jgi:hypothetical protein
VCCITPITVPLADPFLPVAELEQDSRTQDDEGLFGALVQLQNRSLLAKWLVNLLNTNGLWQKLLTNKYLSSKSLTQVKAKPYDSFLERSHED